MEIILPLHENDEVILERKVIFQTSSIMIEKKYPVYLWIKLSLLIICLETFDSLLFSSVFFLNSVGLKFCCDIPLYCSLFQFSYQNIQARPRDHMITVYMPGLVCNLGNKYMLFHNFINYIPRELFSYSEMFLYCDRTFQVLCQLPPYHYDRISGKINLKGGKTHFDFQRFQSMVALAQLLLGLQ